MFSLVPNIHLLVSHRADNFPEMCLLHKNTMTNQPLLFHRQEMTHWITTTFSFHFNIQAKLFKQSGFLQNGEGFPLIAGYFLTTKNKERLVNQCPKLRSLGSQVTGEATADVYKRQAQVRVSTYLRTYVRRFYAEV